ncbi:late embryogenesis abundant protein, LEA-14 [Tanacetum coccineum]
MVFLVCGNETWFFEPKREWGGRGVKEKSGVEPSANKDGVTSSVMVAYGDRYSTQEENSVKAGHDNLHDVNASIGLFTALDGTLNEVTPVSAVMEGVTSSVVDMDGEKDTLSSLEDTTVLGSFPLLPTHVIISAGNVPGKSSYANVSGKPSRKKLNIHTLFTPGGNGIDVVVPVESIRAISERFAYTAYGFFVGKRVAYPVVANYVRNAWGKYGLVRFMFNSSTGLFSFQFSSMDGLDVMLENGPWFI